MMKNIVYLFLLLSFVSCQEEILDLEPLDKFSDASVWSDVNLVETVVNNAYLSLGAYKTDGYGPCSATDQLFEQFWYWSGTNYLVQGTVTPDKANRLGSYMWWASGEGGRWQRFYDFIRDTNVFFSKIDDVEGDEDRIDRMKGEMYYIRAYAYSELINFYGGVPIIEKVYTVDDTEFNEARNTYQECASYIAEQLDLAIDLLPSSYSGDQIGRVTSNAAMALKARQLLYAASPLYNGATFESGYTNGSYNIQLLQEAKTATKLLLDQPEFSLYNPENYHRIFSDKANSEVIFARYFSDEVTIEHENRYGREQGPNSITGWGGYNPLQQFVDKFEMADGSKFDWDNPEHAANPYANREKRFYEDIYYDGSIYNYGGATHEIETFVGGLDSPESSLYAWNASQTGYLPRKHHDETQDWIINNNQNDMWIFFRLSEFYLNYAEILCELGETSEALNWINPIRERVELPIIETTDKEALREKIRHERNIELCFEGQRYQDIRRWGIYKEIMTEHGLGIKITKADDGTKTYETKVTQERTFDPKTWFHPLIRTEIQKNSNLVQNPGYN